MDHQDDDDDDTWMYVNSDDELPPRRGNTRVEKDVPSIVMACPLRSRGGSMLCIYILIDRNYIPT